MSSSVISLMPAQNLKGPNRSEDPGASKAKLMVKDHSPVDIIDISQERLDEAADVLARAFADYPLMHFFFADSGATYTQQVWEALRITCEVRLVLGEPVKGIVNGDRLMAVACIDNPEKKLWPASLEQAYAAFERRIGARAAERLEKYGELTAGYRLDQPHFYLVALGVHPDVQGKGYGRALLDMVHGMSEAHPLSTGVALDTETPTNVPLYEHCGYHVTAQSNLENVNIWFMFRPDGVKTK